MLNRQRMIGLVALVALTAGADGDEAMSKWQAAFADDPKHDWKDDFFLDGATSTVERTDHGLTLKTGAVNKDGSGHAVLWTKQAFDGDVRVEYDFTRLDEAVEHTSVCILYIQATGVGGAFDKDISKWADQRRVAAMDKYYDHMNALHVSYACTGGAEHDYVRARRYPTKGNFQTDTLIDPSYERVGIFRTGETWHLAFEKIGQNLSLTATRGDEKHTWKWDTSKFPPVTEGRIGLRQMHGRLSRYENFKVMQPVKK